MILGVSGHRALYSFPNSTRGVVRDKSRAIIEELAPKTVFTGLALGYDTVIADLCIEMRIPFVGAVPFRGQEEYWSAHDRKHYNDLLAKAERVEVISRSGWANWKFQVRNQWLVDNSDMMLFFYSGAASGTKNAFDYANKTGRKYIRINPLDFKAP
jgi:uncharacterized phage-like protein YoqJ